MPWDPYFRYYFCLRRTFLRLRLWKFDFVWTPSLNIFAISQNCIHFWPLCPHVAHDLKLLLLKNNDRSVGFFRNIFGFHSFSYQCATLFTSTLNHPNQKFEMLWPFGRDTTHQSFYLSIARFFWTFFCLWRLVDLPENWGFLDIFPWVLRKLLSFCTTYGKILVTKVKYVQKFAPLRKFVH